MGEPLAKPVEYEQNGYKSCSIAVLPPIPRQTLLLWWGARIVVEGSLGVYPGSAFCAGSSGDSCREAFLISRASQTWLQPGCQAPGLPTQPCLTSPPNCEMPAYSPAPSVWGR